MNFGVLLFGLVGIITLLGMAAALGLRKLRLLTGDEQEVRAMALEAALGAQVREVAVDADRRAALALLTDGRVFAVRTLGDRLVQRAFAPQAISKMLRVRPKGAGVAVRIAFADWGFPSLLLRFERAEPPPWMERLRRAAAA